MDLQDATACDARLGISINGRSLKALPGETILAAARRHGIEIPTLCHDPRIKPGGKCKLCVVEIAGRSARVLACESPVREWPCPDTEHPGTRVPYENQFPRDRVRVSTRRGWIEVEARVSECSPEGEVFVPFHFAEACTNRLTRLHLDPVSKTPGFKKSAACVERVH